MSSPSEPLAVFAVKEVNGLRRPPGKLLIFPDRLRFEVEGRPACELLHGEHREKSMLHAGLFSSIVIKEPAKRGFELSRDVARAIQGWIGPPTLEDLKLALKRRFAWIVPTGCLFVFLSLPLGDAPFHPILCIEGMILVLIGLLARVSPHRVFFLADAIWFAVIAGTTTWTTLATENYWWFIWVVLQVALVVSGLREFQRFAPEKMAAEEPTDRRQDGHFT